MDLSLDGHSYALIEKQGMVRCYKGTVHALGATEEIHTLAQAHNKDVVFVLPYHVIRERGFEAHGDEPILALLVDEAMPPVSVDDFIAAVPDRDICLSRPIVPVLSDEDQESLIAAFQKEEIEGGNASQVNLSRIFTGSIDQADDATLLTIYKRFLKRSGQYMTVLFCHRDAGKDDTGQYIVGATPECHLEVAENRTVMMPIAGTLRKEDHATFEKRLQGFLIDAKEINELYQVTDEELKMMARICPDGGKIEGPYLKEIGNVVHTFYMLVGDRSPNSLESLRHTLHAPTVVGSPMESAARIIRKYEPQSRRYYAGEIGLYDYTGRDQAYEYGDLDVAILIRCAEVFNDGTFRIQAGAGIVRDSDPASEVKENRAKASVVFDAFTGDGAHTDLYLTPALHETYHPTLMQRNAHLSQFWMSKQGAETQPVRAKVTLINNEDDFCLMLAHLLKSLGCRTRVLDTFDYDPDRDDADIVLVGPGPGDINDPDHPRMVKLRGVLEELKRRKKPLLGICLGHQALATLDGIQVVRQPRSSQGMPRMVQLFGKTYRLGFYNSFSALVTKDVESNPALRLSMDDDGRVIALEGAHYIGFQFHPESIMSEQGREIMRQALEKLMAQAT